MKYLGLDIGGSKIAAVVMDEQGHEWRRFRVETRKQTRQQFIATLVELITAIGDELAQPLAIGIALPGEYLPAERQDPQRQYSGHQRLPLTG